MASFLTHFGLSRHPFDKDLLDADLWLPPSKGDLVEEAVEALRSRESLLLFGECGVGKTCTLRLVRHRLAATASASPTATTPSWAAATSTARSVAP